MLRDKKNKTADSTVEKIKALIKEEVIEIGTEQDQGKDEAWCNWFECPKCKETMITIGSNYCPDCGVKLKWINKEEIIKGL